jgi:hypothetical protein
MRAGSENRSRYKSRDETDDDAAEAAGRLPMK